MLNYFYKFLIVSLLFLNLAQAQNAESIPQASDDLLNDLVYVKKLIQSEEFNSENAIDSLKSIYLRAYNLNPESFNKQLIHRQGAQIISEGYQIREALRIKLRKFENEGRLNRNIIDAAQKINRSVRYLQDMVGEFFYFDPQRKKQLPAFHGGIGYTIFNKNFTLNELKSGDVLLVRGGSFNSAAIARVGDIDSPFSHTALIYVDESYESIGKPLIDRVYVIEALIEKGVIMTTWREFVTHTGPRVSLLRYQDSKIAEKAGAYMFEKIKSLGSGKMKYNFSMDLNIKDSYFCSQLVYEAYQAVGVNINKYPSPINPDYQSLLGPFGVQAKTTITPGSIEFDTEFDIIAEWADYNQTESLRMKDMILWKIYMWLEESQFKFKSTFLERRIAETVHLLSGLKDSLVKDLPWIKDKLKKLPPKEMRADSIAPVLTLHSASTEFYKHLVKLKRQDPENIWTPRETLDAIEKFKQEEIVYKNGGVFKKWKPTYQTPGAHLRCSEIL